MIRHILYGFMFFLGSSLSAQTIWNHASSTAWNTAGNWSAGVPSASTYAQFSSVAGSGIWGISGTTSTTQAIELTSDRTSGVTIGASGTTGALLVFTLNGATLNSTSNVILRNNSSYNLTFQPNNGQSNPNTLSITLGNATDNVISIDGSGNVAFGVIVAGAGKLTLSGAGSGALTLNAANTFSGGMTINSGTRLNINNSSALGTGTFSIAGGTIDNTSGEAINSSANNNTQTWSGNFSFMGSNSLNLGTGTVTLSGGSRTVAVNGSTLSVGGAIGDGSNGYGLSKTGSGTLSLTGNSTFSGGTTISAGTLSAGHNNALGTGAVSVTGGTLSIANNISIGNALSLGSSGTLSGAGASSTYTGLLSGTGTLAGSLTLGSGANINPGNSPGILSNTGTLTFDSGSTYTWELAALSTTGAGTNFDQIANTGIINLNGGSLALSLGSYAPSADPFWTVNRSWTIISTTGGGSITGSAMSISTNQSLWASYGSFSTALSDHNMVLNWNAAAIPEPSTYAALAGLAALLGVLVHRRRKAKLPA